MGDPKPSDLLKAGKAFLREALSNFDDGRLTFALLHLTTATELLLKERLARIHPNLIFRQLDGETIDRQRTVGLRELPNRLRHLGVALDESDVSLVRLVAAWRNDIVHHVPAFPEKDASAKAQRMFDFLLRFARIELGQDMQDLVSADFYRLANDLLDEWRHVVERARADAAASGRELIDHECPGCGAERVLTSGDSEGVGAYCHLCGLEYEMGPCRFCGKLAVARPVFPGLPGLAGLEVAHDSCSKRYYADVVEEFFRDDLPPHAPLPTKR
ncbi:MAG TPA: hypothetical protein VML96_13270 [Egibacteraceae bacterium]|nr:hypothetical protein [Egibacteraceae bacterium]